LEGKENGPTTYLYLPSGRYHSVEQLVASIVLASIYTKNVSFN